MRALWVVTEPFMAFKPMIGFESEADATEFARSMHAGGDSWKDDIHKVPYVPMTYTERMAGLEYIEEIEEVE